MEIEKCDRVMMSNQYFNKQEWRRQGLSMSRVYRVVKVDDSKHGKLVLLNKYGHWLNEEHIIVVGLLPSISRRTSMFFGNLKDEALILLKRNLAILRKASKGVLEYVGIVLLSLSFLGVMSSMMYPVLGKIFITWSAKEISLGEPLATVIYIILASIIVIAFLFVALDTASSPPCYFRRRRW